MPKNQVSPLGLLLMAIAVTMLLVALLAMTFNPVAVSWHGIDPFWFVFVIPAAGVIAQLAAILGMVLCLKCPREIGRKGWLLGAAILMGMSIVAEFFFVVASGLWNEGQADNVAIAVSWSFPAQLGILASFACLLIWLRSVALYYQTPKPAKQASDLLATGSIIFLITLGMVAWMTIRHAAGNTDVQSLDRVDSRLGLFLCGMVIAMFVWIGGLASLLFSLRRQLLKASE
jgi:hypothetical protein